MPRLLVARGAIAGLCAVLAVVASAAPGGAAARAAGRTAVTLRVRVLPTTYGVRGRHPAYPKDVQVEAPARLASALAAYGVGGYVLVAPKGWTGSGTVGADGSSQAALHATAAATTRGSLAFEQTSACWGCAWDAAAPYFAWVRRHWRASQLGGEPPHARRGLAESPVRADLVLYTAAGAARGLAVDGVAYAAVVGDRRWHGAPGPGFEQEEVALPAGGHALATVILQSFVSRYVPGR